ncbi:MAG: Na+/H+ antiporter subunit E [Ignisphaera sp.]|nr:Na+/H+ antiporter subunit E [Ignisphaera sp.]MCX8168285.1 Na+/H+ antiporter subunit E [Ignisphaera sp.]MDW8085895.1 Na+/H+ antiporter subunit E [Ignisphaera sp.]
MKRLLRAFSIILFSFLLYLVYSGSMRLYDIVTGIAVSLAIGIIMAPIVVENWRKSLDIYRLLYLIKYIIVYFFIYEVKSHLNVIKLGLSPSMPIRPGVVRVPICSKSGYALTLLSLSITNTPGTVVVDIDEDKSTLYVNWIYVTTVESEKVYREVVGEFDVYAKKIFD